MTNITLHGAGNQYSDSSFMFTIPSGSAVTSASVNLEGLSVSGPPQTLTCDFSQPDATNHFAYKGSYNQNDPGGAAPASFSATQVPSGDISLISASDNKYAYISVFGYPSPYGYQLFKFKVAFPTLIKATVTWEGYVGESFSGVGTATVYVWNNTRSGWETVGTDSQSPDSTITKEFFGQSYIDADGYLYVLAFCTVGVNFYGEFINSISTDYVKVMVQGVFGVYPSNPSMDIGINGKPEWSITTNRFNYQIAVSNAAMRNEIQNLVKNVKTEYVDINVKFSSESEGVIRVSDFKVVYNASPWCVGIPNTFAFDEDTEGTRLIDLNMFFNDTDGQGVSALKYEIVYQEDSTKLVARLDPDGHSLDFAAAPDWWGTQRFRVKASDKEGFSRDSNNFTVTVRSMNDPPVLEPIGDQTAVQDVRWYLQVVASDRDAIFDLEETITFSDNSSLFDIDPQTGEAYFTPRQNEVGTYAIRIMATDREGATDMEDFTLVIKDTEEPPVLLPIPNQNATAGEAFNYTVLATDPDLPYGDTLDFSDDCPLFQIDPVSGLISFTPGDGDLGSYKVTITVNDSRGGSDSGQFTLNVLNSMGTTNRPPSIDAISDKTVDEGALFEYTVKASDPDLGKGDALTFSDDSPLFDITPSSGKISFRPLGRDAGVYNITVTVKDREGLSATTGFRLTVVKVNHRPVILSISPANGTKVMRNDGVYFTVNASDPDGDNLSVKWMLGNLVLGHGSPFQTNFTRAGIQKLTVIVSDGRLQSSGEVSIEVVAPPTRDNPASGGDFPLYLIVPLAMLLATVLLAGILVLKRRQGVGGR